MNRPEINFFTMANNAYFNRSDVWQAVSAAEQRRITDTHAMIPSDITTILNAGCGDGRITDSLVGEKQITGLDISSEAFNSFRGTPVIGSLDKMPFANQKFDMVLATEVLEHIPSDIYRKSLEELQRISGKYILITVPNRENLIAGQMRCAKCDSQYHLWNHLNSFDEFKLRSLFTDFKPVSIQPMGVLIPCAPTIFYTLLQNYGDTWAYSEKALCPFCGAPGSESKGNLFGKIFKRVTWRIESFRTMKKAFLGALYEREKASVLTKGPGGQSL